MRIDADVAETVMLILMRQGVSVLPIHDSFMVPASQVDKLESAMIEAAHGACLYALEIEAK